MTTLTCLHHDRPGRVRRCTPRGRTTRTPGEADLTGARCLLILPHGPLARRTSRDLCGPATLPPQRTVERAADTGPSRAARTRLR